MFTALVAKESASWAHENTIFMAMGKTDPVRDDVICRYCAKIREHLSDLQAETRDAGQ